MTRTLFVETISQFGFTKETYLEHQELAGPAEAARGGRGRQKKPSDEDIVAYLNENLGSYNDARRSSHILFKVAEDATEEERAKVEAKAQKVLDKLNAGEIEFAKAAEKYSEDSSAKNGGDVGWDKLTTFVTEYQDALSGLSDGQMSGLVKTTYGYHIIKCTGQFNVQTVSSIDEVPEGIRDAIAERIKTTAEAKVLQWLTEYTGRRTSRSTMPEEVPYNVDMDKALAEGDKADKKDADGKKDSTK